MITEAQVRLHPLAPAEGRRAYGFAGLRARGSRCVGRILRRGATPAVLRLYDATESARNFELTDQCALVVLDEADEGLLDATLGRRRRRVRGGGGAPARRRDRGSGGWGTATTSRPWRRCIAPASSSTPSRSRRGGRRLPLLYDACVVRAARDRGHPGRLGAPEPRLRRRRLSVLHLRRAHARAARPRPTPTDARSRRLGRAVLHLRVAGRSWTPCGPTAAPSATTTGWASTGAGSWPTPSAAPSTCSWA